MEPVEELELADYLAILRRRWLWATSPVIVLVVAAVLFTVAQDATYQATATVLLRTSAAEEAVGNSNTNTGLLSRELSNEISYATSDAVNAQVDEALGDVPDIEVSADAEADLLSFSAEAGTPQDAAEIANTWAGIYVSQKQADALSSITAATDQLAERLTELRDQRRQLRAPLDELRDQLAALPVDADGDVEDPELQVRLSNQIERLEGDLAPELDLLAAQQEAIGQNIANLNLKGELARTGTARVVNQAAPPETASNAPLSRNLALAIAVGAIVGVAAALLRENLDRALKSPDDVQRLIGLPVLAAVPRQLDQERLPDLALATLHHPESQLADAYHKVRTALQFAMVNRQIRSVLVTSPNQGEGKTVSSANLAWAMASVMDEVLLLDGDFRRPRVHQVYGAPNDRGVTDNVVSGLPLQNLAIRVEAADSHLTVIRTGPLPPNPSDFIASAPFTSTVTRLAVESDLLVVDGPPVLPVSDALSLARQVDVVIVVAYADRTTTDELRRAVESLHQVGAEVLGVILVAVKGGGAYYRYGYYSSEAADAGHRTIDARIVLPRPPARGGRGRAATAGTNGAAAVRPRAAGR